MANTLCVWFVMKMQIGQMNGRKNRMLIKEKPSQLVGKAIVDTYQEEANEYIIQWAYFMNVGLYNLKWKDTTTWNWQRVKRRFILKEI